MLPPWGCWLEVKTIESSLHDYQNSLLPSTSTCGPLALKPRFCHSDTLCSQRVYRKLVSSSSCLFTMRSQNLPHGKFYTVLSQTGISQQYATTDACLPKAARGHMVMVLGWADRWNWVKVVSVSIFLTLGVQCKWVISMMSRSHPVPPLHYSTSTTYPYIRRRKINIVEFSWNCATAGTLGLIPRRSLMSRWMECTRFQLNTWRLLAQMDVSTSCRASHGTRCRTS